MTLKNTDTETYINNLKNNDRFWCPNKVVKGTGRFNSFYDPKISFNDKWENYVNEVYLPSVSVYSCQISDKNIG